MRGRRVSPRPRRDGKRTPGRTLTMHRLGSDRGEGGNRRDPGGPGRGIGDAGTAHHLPSKGDRSDSPGRGTVMVDQGPGPLGLCPVRGIVEVEQASNIWLANPG